MVYFMVILVSIDVVDSCVVSEMNKWTFKEGEIIRINY